MRQEWAAAGLGRRIVFSFVAIYWIGMGILTVLNLPYAEDARQAGQIIGFFFAPLIIAVVVRGAYVLLTRARFWSSWIFIIGAGLGLMLAFQRVVSLADGSG